jgi:predicted nuclease of predicted toxin-antitoxin system
VKFVVDMPLPPALARWLSVQGHDAVHALDVRLDRAPDAEIILHARQAHRIIVTADLDYPRLLALSGALDPGLILFRGGNWSEEDVVSRLNHILVALDPAEIEQSILVVDRDRVRRRRLPIG